MRLDCLLASVTSCCELQFCAALAIIVIGLIDLWVRYGLAKFCNFFETLPRSVNNMFYGFYFKKRDSAKNREGKLRLV